MIRSPKNLAPELLKRVQIMPNGCWEIEKCRDKGGYGRIYVDGRLWRAHRYSYTRHVKPIPAGLFVCHRCDNPPCVRPSHLWVGSARENTWDAQRKGRPVGKWKRRGNIISRWGRA